MVKKTVFVPRHSALRSRRMDGKATGHSHAISAPVPVRLGFQYNLRDKPGTGIMRDAQSFRIGDKAAPTSKPRLPEGTVDPGIRMLTKRRVTLAAEAQAVAIAELSRDGVEQGLGWYWTPGRVLQAILDPEVNVAVVTEQSRTAFAWRSACDLRAEQAKARHDIMRVARNRHQRGDVFFVPIRP